MNTTIRIPGRTDQTIPGLVMTKEAVIASYAGTVDLSGMEVTESREGDNVTLTFANRTGTKGADVTVNIENVNVSGDVVVNATRIEIPGRQAQTLPNVSMSPADIVAAFAGTVSLSGMQAEDTTEGNVRVVRFSNRTGTKGNGQVSISDIFAAIQGAQGVRAVPAAADAPVALAPEEIAVEDEDVIGEEAPFTRIVIPGRTAQIVPDMIMDAQLVKNSFAGTLDLSSYDVEEIEDGAGIEIRFTARTGTKG